MGNMYHAIDARTATHIPTSYPTGPYMVVRDRCVINANTGADRQIHIFGEHRNQHALATAVDTRIKVIGKSGNAALGQLPSNMWYQNADNLDPFMPTANDTGGSIALHAMTITISCSTPALTAGGVIHYGTLRGTFTASDYEGTTNGIVDMVDTLLKRPEIASISAYTACTRPMMVVSAPLDCTQHSMFNRLVGTPGEVNDAQMTDSMQPVVVILPPNNNFQITVYTEWRVVAHASPTYSSLHTMHKPTPLNLWHSITEVVTDAAGRIGGLMASGAEVAGRFARGFASGYTPVSPVPALSVGRRPLMLGN